MVKVVFGIILVMAILVLAIIQASKIQEIDNLSSTSKTLQSIADTTIISKKGWEPVISEAGLQEIIPDAWGTSIRLLYLKVPDMTIALAVSAGPDCIWDTDDDVFGAAYRIDSY